MCGNHNAFVQQSKKRNLNDYAKAVTPDIFFFLDFSPLPSKPTTTLVNLKAGQNGCLRSSAEKSKKRANKAAGKIPPRSVSTPVIRLNATKNPRTCHSRNTEIVQAQI